MTTPEPDGTNGTAVPEHPGSAEPPGTDPARLRWSDVGLVAAVAVLVRMVVVVGLARDPQGLHDPYLYRAFARGLADGAGYVGLLGNPTTYYPPGYPVFLGGVQWIADAVGQSDRLPLFAGVVQALLGGVAAGATAVAAARLWDGRPEPSSSPSPARRRRLVLVAGLIVALWPNLVLYSAVLLSESLFVALFAVFVAAVLSLGDLGRPRPGVVVLAAASFGAATLVRPQVLISLPFLALAWWLARVGWRRVLVGSGVLAVGAAAFVVPWTIRNAVVMDQFVPISTNGGDNLCIGFHDGADGRFSAPAACATDGSYVDGPEVEVERDAQNRDRAVEWATSHLTELPLLSVRKVWHTFASDRDALFAVESYGSDAFVPSGLRRFVAGLGDAVYYAILVAAAVGVAVSVPAARRRQAAPLLLLGLTAAGVLVPALFFGDPRFKVALVPCLAVLAAAGVDAVTTRFGGSS